MLQVSSEPSHLHFYDPSKWSWVAFALEKCQVSWGLGDSERGGQAVGMGWAAPLAAECCVHRSAPRHVLAEGVASLHMLLWRLLEAQHRSED